MSRIQLASAALGAIEKKREGKIFSFPLVYIDRVVMKKEKVFTF